MNPFSLKFPFSQSIFYHVNRQRNYATVVIRVREGERSRQNVDESEMLQRESPHLCPDHGM